MLQVSDYPLDLTKTLDRPKSGTAKNPIHRDRTRRGSGRSLSPSKTPSPRDWVQGVGEGEVGESSRGGGNCVEDKEVQTDIDSVHYKVTSNYIQGMLIF